MESAVVDSSRSVSASDAAATPRKLDTAARAASQRDRSRLVSARQPGTKGPNATLTVNRVTAALREARERWEHEPDARRLRLALLDVLRALDAGDA